MLYIINTWLILVERTPLLETVGSRCRYGKEAPFGGTEIGRGWQISSGANVIKLFSFVTEDEA